MADKNDRDESGRVSAAGPRAGPDPSGNDVPHGAPAPDGTARATAERSRIARVILDVITDEIVRRLKRRFPDPAAMLAVRGRRRSRSEPVSPAVPPRQRSGRPRKSILFGPRGRDEA